MATALPPEEDLPIFDTTVFYDEEGFLTKKTADKLYLKFPVAQGDETLLNATVAGNLQINNLINFYNTIDNQVDSYMDYDRSKSVLRVAMPYEGVVIEGDLAISPVMGTFTGGRLVLRDPINGTTNFNTTNGAVIGKLLFSGHSLNGVQGQDAQITVVAAGAFTNISKPTKMDFFTTNTNSILPASRMTILQNGNIGVGTTAPGTTFNVRNTAATAETMTVDGNNASVSIKQYLQNSVPTSGNIEIYTAAAAGNFSTISRPGDSGINSDSTHNLIFGTGTTGLIACQANNGRVGIKPSSIANDISATFTVVGINTDRVPMAIRTVGTATFVGMNLTCAGPTLSNSSVNSDVNGLHLTPHVTARGCQISGDVCPRLNNTYECGAATLYWNTVRGFNAYVQVSDERLKTDIRDLDLGIDFIKKLRPVTYKWKIGQNQTTEERDEEGNLKVDGDRNPLSIPIAGHREHLGLIAQDVGALTKQIGRDLSLWALDDKDDLESGQTLKMGELISPIIKALQQLDDRLQSFDNRLKALESL